MSYPSRNPPFGRGRGSRTSPPRQGSSNQPSQQQQNLFLSQTQPGRGRGGPGPGSNPSRQGPNRPSPQQQNLFLNQAPTGRGRGEPGLSNNPSRQVPSRPSPQQQNLFLNQAPAGRGRGGPGPSYPQPQQGPTQQELKAYNDKLKAQRAMSSSQLRDTQQFQYGGGFQEKMGKWNVDGRPVLNTDIVRRPSTYAPMQSLPTPFSRPSPDAGYQPGSSSQYPYKAPPPQGPAPTYPKGHTSAGNRRPLGDYRSSWEQWPENRPGGAQPYQGYEFPGWTGENGQGPRDGRYEAAQREKSKTPERKPPGKSKGPPKPKGGR